MKRSLLSAVFAAAAVAGVAPQAMAQATEPFLGQTILVGFPFCPRNWTEANGQLLSISSNTALFSLYGTTFGGNGTSNFALPDLRGRVPVGQGTGPGLSRVVTGEVFGNGFNSLTISQMPSHTHQFMAATSGPVSNLPAGGMLATYPGSTPVYTDKGSVNQRLNQGVIGTSGGGQPFSNYQPTLTLRYCVSLSGVYPSRP